MAKILQLSNKLLWSHIKEMYQNEWVELVECDWKWGSASPRRAIVRHHSSDRAMLLKQIQKAGDIPGSTVLFVGLTDSVVSFDLAGAAA